MRLVIFYVLQIILFATVQRRIFVTLEPKKLPFMDSDADILTFSSETKQDVRDSKKNMK